ncbi:MAG: hypothetical protein JWQ78_727 [Sediminibacterium sp.]|nr:hypothetical protein [Sediminibacterium sp.]
MPTTDTKTNSRQDLADSARDRKRMQPEETTIDLPDVEDIPGQEHIHVPKMKEFHDTTISSDDEEGKRIFEEDETDAETDVTEEERELLTRSEDSMASVDDEDLRRMKLDETDLDGELLNEKEDLSGSDLDVPGANEDDADEELGEEDEENNTYSLGGDRKD